MDVYLQADTSTVCTSLETTTHLDITVQSSYTTLMCVKIWINLLSRGKLCTGATGDYSVVIATCPRLYSTENCCYSACNICDEISPTPGWQRSQGQPYNLHHIITDTQQPSSPRPSTHQCSKPIYLEGV